MSIGAKFLGRVIEYTEDKTITISTGYITLILGLVTVTLHNIWTADLRVAVTILGWTTLLKGIEKVGFPNRINKKAQIFKGGQILWGFVILAIGGFYFWTSFV